MVQAAPEVWRAVVRYGGAEADKIAVAFEMSAAAGDSSKQSAAERDAARHLLDVQEQAALKIQSTYRGHQVRVSPDKGGDKRLAELRQSMPGLYPPAQSQNRFDPARQSLSVERAKAEAALAAVQAGLALFTLFCSKKTIDACYIAVTVILMSL